MNNLKFKLPYSLLVALIFISSPLAAIGSISLVSKADMAGVLFAMPLMIFIWVFIYWRDNQKNKFMAMCSSGGIGEPSYHYWNGLKWHGIAIHLESEAIFFWCNGTGKTYPWSMVRSWEKKAQTGGMIYGGGATGLMHNLDKSRSNAINTGLLIHVADFENPSWMIHMPKEVDRNRWFELMIQVINEGRRPAQH
ncbi:MAG: DUF4755 domain-containing protein [Leptothrix ochracea]|uniref:DUF4755 domain-containing protein n=1 Tax=Leptothrix ochracea TaxID=735331 RepID=UPI0034E20DFF